MTKPPADPVELARSVTRDVFEVLVDVMTHPEATHANRLSAASVSPRAATRRCARNRSAARMALEGLYVPAAAPWLADLRSELLSFPAGRHDDQVDAIGLVGQLLDRMFVPGKPRPDAKPPRDRWDAADGGEKNWKLM